MAIQIPTIDISLRSINDITPRLLSQIPLRPIECANWKEFPHKPQVGVRVAKTAQHLLLHFEVEEGSIRAKWTKPNEAVWTDSCVEFFVSSNNKQTYYNFEFNCIGVPLLHYNTAPHDGVCASPELMESIFACSSLGTAPIPFKTGDVNWNMSITIPYTCFFAHPHENLREKTLHGNFYKCGDELEIPHYLSMFPIYTPKPDFHCPQFFQQLTGNLLV